MLSDRRKGFKRKHWKDKEPLKKIPKQGDDTTDRDDGPFDWRKAAHEAEEEVKALQDETCYVACEEKD